MTDDTLAAVAILAGAFALCVAIGILTGAWFG